MPDKEVPTLEHLPIKLILPKQGKEKPNLAGGSPPVPFRTVNAEYRRSLNIQLTAIGEVVTPQAKQLGTVPIRVRLIDKALAKSHRPDHLFSNDTCPIIGVGKPGELFLRATEVGLARLTKVVEHDEAKQMVKEISSVQAFEPVTPSFRRRGAESKDILRYSPRSKNGFMTRVRLFNVGSQVEQELHVKNFAAVCGTRNMPIHKSGYSENSFVYGVECHTVEDVDALSRIIGVRSIVSMPIVRTTHPHDINPKPLPKLIKREDVTGDVPVVVVVDTGISDKIPTLNSWVVGRESYVAEQYRNVEHGTFVAGLICWGSQLNTAITGIDNNPCAVFDLQIIPNHKPENGATDFVTEQEFLASLDETLQRHANEYKVWNLSFSTEDICSLDDFSAFAEELDNFQQKYEVSFVISSGNFSNPPLLNYPRQGTQLEVGRITIPADSVLGITVGSVCHLGCPTPGPNANEPSAFSRHGAGPNYIIKPDLVHFGGACSIDGSHPYGIRSLSETGTAENLGTSFSTPLVSKTLAQIYHQLTPSPKPTLARALLTHHARDPRTHGRVPDKDENCFGFGLPSTVPYCLECTPYSSTLLFDDVLRPGYYLEWDNFPYPSSLSHDGKYYGEIWMTVAFAPVRGSRWGSEYCETHIDAHFGVYRDHIIREKGKTTGKTVSEFHGLVPPEHKNVGILYESYQVQQLRKWAPVRTYYGYLGEKGEKGTRWRLRVSLLTRHGVEDMASFQSQPFSLVLTIADPAKRAPVYDEMARSLRTRFQAQNITLRAVARVRGTT